MLIRILHRYTRRFAGLLPLLVGAALAAAGATSPATTAVSPPGSPAAARHSFAIGETEFLLDGQPLLIRCGEMHFARVPREYWQHRLRLIRAMGLNAVCAYLFWNFHEGRPGEFNWSAERDVAEFCRLAQQEGLWVVLRPGPYACAEWEMGGLPWWLLKNEGVKLRSRDSLFLEASRRWFAEVGKVLAPLQVTRGGPILLVQVENEYGFYGHDAEYMGEIRQQILDAGFDVPLFACNPTNKLKEAYRSDLLQVVNFGRDPEGAFRALREVQKTGPLMCGEFYPGWFDTWGQPHHLGDTARYLADLEYMLKHRASFSIYMAHGGTSFGLWAGADRPFKPDTSSYDYDAPIGEAGNIGEKFRATRELMSRYLEPGEVLPEPPPPQPVVAVPAFTATEVAPLFSNLPAGRSDTQPRTLEAYHVGQGVIVYRTILPPGPKGVLRAAAAHDFAWAFLDGAPLGVMDRRKRHYEIEVPVRTQPAELDLLVYPMGRVNFGVEVHDRKGLHAPVRFEAEDGTTTEPKRWEIFALDLGDGLPRLAWKAASSLPSLKSGTAFTKPEVLPTTAHADAGLSTDATAKRAGPAFWKARFHAPAAGDTFLDMRRWGKGIAWLNGRCLGRFWNIGPTQTMYVPGPWIRPGENEVVVLDLLGPETPVLAGLEKPILNELKPGNDFFRPRGFGSFSLESVKLVHDGVFASGDRTQDVMFARTVEARQLCLESLSAHDGKPFAAVAELDILDDAGAPIPHATWTVAYVDSEEMEKEDGSALNAINGQTADYWHTAWSARQPGHPHRLVIDLGKPERIRGLRYTPRAGTGSETGRIATFRVYVGDKLGSPATK